MWMEKWELSKLYKLRGDQRRRTGSAWASSHCNTPRRARTGDIQHTQLVCHSPIGWAEGSIGGAHNIADYFYAFISVFSGHRQSNRCPPIKACPAIPSHRLHWACNDQ